VRLSLVAPSLLLAVLAASCSKPQPPVLTPKETRVTAIDGTSLTILAKVDAFNPNGFDLATRSVKAHVVLDDNVDLGTVTAPNGVNIPAKSHTELSLPLSLKWADVTVVAKLAASAKPMPYRVDGTVTIGGDRLNVDVPFTISGTIAREQLLGAALRALPPLPALPR
jgi:LEA14-like dessication related protein